MRIGHQAVEGHQRKARRRQPLRQRAEHRDAGARCEIERRDHDGGGDHGDQHAGDARPPLQDENQRERAAADRKHRDVRVSRPHLVDDSPHLTQRSVRLTEKPKSFGIWLRITVSAMPFM